MWDVRRGQWLQKEQRRLSQVSSNRLSLISPICARMLQATFVRRFPSTQVLFALSKSSRCDDSGISRSTTQIAIASALIGVPLLAVFWWFFAARSLFVAGEEELQNTARQHQGHNSSASICLRSIQESWFYNRVMGWFYNRVMAPTLVPARAKVVKMVPWLIKNNPKQYVKIIVSFFQESTAR